MHFIDRFVDSILVCPSRKSIVLKVVDSLQEQHAPAGVSDLVLDGLPPEEVVDCEEHA